MAASSLLTLWAATYCVLIAGTILVTWTLGGMATGRLIVDFVKLPKRLMIHHVTSVTTLHSFPG